MTEPAPGPARFPWQQAMTLLLGAFYLVFGVVGFFFVRRNLDDAVTGQAPDSLLGIGLNGAQNFLHVLLGVLGLVMATRLRTARIYGAILAVLGAALFIFGAFAVGRSDLNFLDLNWPANVLHLLTALVGAAIAAVPVRARESAAPPS
jgi:hypothetical protein